MKCKAAIFDIDGTLVPVGSAKPSARTVKALHALQQKGVILIIATGRAQFAAKAVLGQVKADYYVTACGNLIQDSKGRRLAENMLSTEEMYALVDFFEDHELALDFIFSDAYYSYVEHEKLVKAYEDYEDSLQFLRNGEDQVRHLESMPYGATGIITPQEKAQFEAKYGHLGLRFVSFGGNFCDVVRADTNKAVAVGKLLERLGIAWEHTVAFGDGGNDSELLAAAGFAVAMENGNEALKAAADLIAPSAAHEGVAQVVEKYFL